MVKGEFKPVIAKGNPEFSLAGLMLKLKLQYFGQRADSQEKTLMPAKTEGRGDGGRDGWMASSAP